MDLKYQALGVFYGLVYGFFDRRGAIMALAASALDDPSVAPSLALSALPTGISPDEIVVTSSVRKCRINISPTRLVLTTLQPFGIEEFRALAGRIHAGLADLFKDVNLDKIGVVAITSSEVGGESGPSGVLERAARVLSTSLGRAVELKSTSASEDRWYSLTVCVAPGTSRIQVQLDMQKTKDPTWDDIQTLPAEAGQKVTELTERLLAT